MSGLYILAGINHIIHPEVYKKIMPHWLGWHDTLINVSGICEILFGLLLIPSQTRVIAAWCVIALLVGVFPANIQMMLNELHKNNLRLLIRILRLPLQFGLIWWAYLFTKPLILNNSKKT